MLDAIVEPIQQIAGLLSRAERGNCSSGELGEIHNRMLTENFEQSGMAALEQLAEFFNQRVGITAGKFTPLIALLQHAGNLTLQQKQIVIKVERCIVEQVLFLLAAFRQLPDGAAGRQPVEFAGVFDDLVNTAES